MMLESGLRERERERERENEEKILIAVWPLQWSAARHSTGPFYAATTASPLQVWMSAEAEADYSPPSANYSFLTHPTSPPPQSLSPLPRP
jgi:hypothetical protein